jgi:curved DNA-binding protein CbpA
MLDLYQVLGIDDRNATAKEIKMKYTKLAIKYHPDKNDNADSKLFELIQKAWAVLGNDDKRKEYDRLYTSINKSKKNDHISLKKDYDAFMQLYKESDHIDKGKDKATDEFNKYMVCDTEHMPDNKNNTNSKNSKNMRLHDNLELQREHEEIEFMHEKIDNIDNEKFNAIFEFYKNKGPREGELTNYTEGGPSAYNMTSHSLFSELDTPFDTEIKIKKSDLNKIKLTKEHTLTPEEVKQDMEKRLKEREAEDNMYKNRDFNSFNTNVKDSYLFLHETGPSDKSTLLLDMLNNDENDLSNLCDKLFELEKK